jgi:solute carrier family 9B (sodium/hydrogen exchanger), member 1/2
VPPLPPPVPPAACCQKTAWLRLLDPRRCRSQLHQHRATRQLFPPKGNTATFLTLVAAAVAVFLLARTLLGAVAAPGGPIFALMLLTLVCVMAGQAVKIILYLIQEMTGMAATCPPFVGMFIIGIVLRNVPYNLVTLAYNSECSALAEQQLQLQAEAHVHTMNVLMDDDESEQSHHQLSTATTATTTAAMTMTTADCTPRYIGEDLHPAITVVMRVACLNGILTLAGLELDHTRILPLLPHILSASVLPILVEAFVVVGLARGILGINNWIVGLVLGFILTGSSPAVLIPMIVPQSRQRLGKAHGIPTLALISCTLGDVLSLAGYGIAFGVFFGRTADKDVLTTLILQFPLDIVIGLAFGIFWGSVLCYLPSRHSYHVVFFRWLLLFCGGMTSIAGGRLFGYEGAGSVACMTGACVASAGWRSEGWAHKNPVSKIVQKMAIILQPIYFGLMGTEVKLSAMDGLTVGHAFALLLICVGVRFASCVLSVSLQRSTNWRERLYLAVTWVPKGLVQTQLGPVFLAKVMAERPEDAEAVLWGRQILTVCMLSAIVYVPVGGFLIQYLGPKLLTAAPLLPSPPEALQAGMENGGESGDEGEEEMGGGEVNRGLEYSE